MPSAKLDALWADYAEHHRAGGNQLCHMLGIPLIILGLLGLLLALPHFRIVGFEADWAMALVVVAGVAYLWLDPRLGAAMIAADVVLYLVARQLNWKIALALFLAGWVFQFIGHGVYEKRAPAFSKNLAHLLVGPLWVLNHAVHLRREGSQPAASVQG
ncbi:MAG TPA: Mpo1-like protein [Terriglobia bacterium]|nr:Mpo1-like protein [Terriglobia bacterium]